MAQEHIALGTPPAGVDGDTDRQAWVKAEDNFTELYSILGSGDGSIVAQVGKNTADIATLQTSDAAQDGDIADIQAKDTAQDGAIAANAGDIATLKTQAANTSPMGAFKNKIINGNFDFWQRGISFPATVNYVVNADRWRQGCTACTMQVARAAFAVGAVTVPNNPLYFARIVLVSVAGANNAAQFYQSIEGVRTFQGGQCTLSFYARCQNNPGKKISVQTMQGMGTGGSPSPNVMGENFVVTLGSDWQKFTHTYTLASIAGLTLGTSGNDGLIFNFWLDAGANVNAGGIGQSSGTIDIAQVQVEGGAAATQWEDRALAVELLLCQRYYRMSPIYATGRWSGNNTARIYFDFNNGMRAQPAAILGSQSVAIEEAQVAAHTCTDASFTTVVGDNYRMFCDIKGTWSGAAPTPGNMAQLNSAQGQIGFDAEI